MKGVNRMKQPQPLDIFIFNMLPKERKKWIDGNPFIYVHSIGKSGDVFRQVALLNPITGKPIQEKK